MKKITKILLFTISVLMIGSTVYASDVIEPYEKEITYYLDEETGFVSTDYGETKQTKTLETVYTNISEQYISSRVQESYYRSLEEVTAQFPGTRDQNPYGSCWAFSTVALAEFDMVQNHGASKSVDYSELGLMYYTYWTATDKLGNFNGDYRYIPSNSSKDFANSGSYAKALNTLSCWKGLVNESLLPYGNVPYVLKYGLDASYATMRQEAVLTDGYMIDIKNNSNAVKAAIKEYGAVAISYHSDESMYGVANGYASYYCPYDYQTDHGVVIVGWDDNFSTSNFGVYVPSSPGAWLVRNSWTTNTGMSLYSYFWLSYEDKSIDEYAYVMNFEPGTTYDNNYQHDGAASEVLWVLKGAANVFTAKNPDNAGSELLKSVMIKHNSEDEETYKIKIYVGLKDNSDPTSGKLQKRATTTVTLSNMGVFTVELKEAVPLKEGETFAVVVLASDGSAVFSTEYTETVSYYDSYGNLMPWYSTTAHMDAGESFINTGTDWEDLTDLVKSGVITVDGIGNAKIKALTKNTNAKTYTISYVLNGGTNKASNPYRYCSDLGKITLQTPTRKGYYFQGWYKDSSYKTKVTSLSGDLKSNLTLYAKWRKVEYKVTLGYTGTIYTGKSLTPKVTVKDEFGNTLTKGTDYTVKYTNNKQVGLAKVTVTFKGLPYSLTKTVKFKIYPKTPTSCKAVLTGYDDVKVTWSKSTYADGYNLYYKKSTDSEYTFWKSTTAVSASISNLKDGVKYTFKVVPYFKSSSGTKYLSNKNITCSVYTLKQIAAPAVSVSGTKVKVVWKNIYGETGYQISKSATKGKTNIISTYATTDGTTKTFSATLGKTYYYKVRAYKIVGDKKIYGPWSSEVKYVRHAAAPASVKAVLYGYDDVKVTWSKVSEATGYAVYFKKASASSYTLKCRTTNLSCKFADLADGTKYTFKIVPYTKVDGKIVNSTNYKTVKLTTLKKVTMTSVTVQDTGVLVKWKNIANETGYQISRSETKTGTNIVKTIKTASGTSKAISATPEKTYYYKVRAYKTVNGKNIYGPWSKVMSAKVPGTGSISLSVTSMSGTTCTLSADTYPANAAVTWSTSNAAVATVQNGVVQAVGKGTAVITAEITYYNKSYTATKNINVTENIDYGQWTSWSLTPAYASSTQEVRYTPMYRYYCFYCPVCGGREPFSGNSDCYGYTLTGGDWQEIWSLKAYSQCGGTQWPLATSKMYTDFLGDGNRWSFSTANLYDTAVGTLDGGYGDVVIKQGYSYRSVNVYYSLSVN